MMEVKEKTIEHKKKPEWIRVKLPTGKKYTELRGLVEKYKLNTNYPFCLASVAVKTVQHILCSGGDHHIHQYSSSILPIMYGEEY